MTNQYGQEEMERYVGETEPHLLGHAWQMIVSAHDCFRHRASEDLAGNYAAALGIARTVMSNDSGARIHNSVPPHGGVTRSAYLASGIIVSLFTSYAPGVLVPRLPGSDEPTVTLDTFQTIGLLDEPETSIIGIGLSIATLGHKADIDDAPIGAVIENPECRYLSEDVVANGKPFLDLIQGDLSRIEAMRMVRESDVSTVACEPGSVAWDRHIVVAEALLGICGVSKGQLTAMWEARLKVQSATVARVSQVLRADAQDIRT